MFSVLYSNMTTIIYSFHALSPPRYGLTLMLGWICLGCCIMSRCNTLFNMVLLPGKHFQKVRYIVWHSVTRCLWLLRNWIIFQDACFDMIAILDYINLELFINREGRDLLVFFFFFPDWCSNPVKCLRLCWGHR